VADVLPGPDGVDRCWWCGSDPDYVAYHDGEWGLPLRGDAALYPLLCLEGFQAGLSWITILRKRPAFLVAFDGFDVETVAGYGAPEVDRLLGDAGIVRHRGKVTATIDNARAVIAMGEAGTSLTQVVWTHAPLPRAGPLTARSEIPASTPESTALSRALKRWGMRFVGPTTVYAFMQSAGLVDDHLAGCHRAGAGAGLRRQTRRDGDEAPPAPPSSR
jgi:DNA-3-methyladenine glycosylase I